jgi:archaellum component FlaG (FlaF/FlaG flagellin family)
MSDKKIIITVTGLSMLVLIGGVVLASRAPKQPEIIASKKARVSIAETTHDWGAIPIDGGKVQKSFMIKNEGSDSLQLANVETSCMCTEAKIKINENESPNFGMHSNSSWIGELEPGKEAELQVIFDPAYHGPSGTGQISRIVSVETNDQNNPILEFILSANVIN